MPDRHRIGWVLVALMAFILASRVAQLISVLSLPGGFFDGTNLGYELRQRRFEALEPGLLTFAVAVLARFAVAGPVRRAAGWFCVISAVIGFAAVTGIWIFEAFGGPQWGRFEPVRIARHLASLVLIGAMAWWGLEAVAAKSRSDEVAAADLA